MKRLLKAISIVFAAILMAACAHPITMRANLDNISAVQADKKISKSVAYYIEPIYLNSEVTTAGGGGDKVRYFPYQDVEPGLFKVLSTVFKDVNRIKSADDKEAMSKFDVAFVINPLIQTDSSSPSPFTWPPTKFKTELTCKIMDKNGQVVTVQKVVGEGSAEFDEFKSDFSLSARRSTEDALKKLQKALLEAPELRK